MSVTAPRGEPAGTLAKLLEQIGSVPTERIPYPPAPGTATEEDVFRRPGGEKRLYELVCGVLVEKPMGYYESLLAAVLIRMLGAFVAEKDLGIVLGEAATLRLAPGLVRAPDVSFISWRHFPGRKLPAEPIPDLAPDLAVEILSRSNTRTEMALKLQEYFAAGTTLVWYLDPEARTVRVHTSPEDSALLAEGDTLEGEPVLPGFRLPVRDWLDAAGNRAAIPRKR